MAQDDRGSIRVASLGLVRGALADLFGSLDAPAGPRAPGSATTVLSASVHKPSPKSRARKSARAKTFVSVAATVLRSPVPHPLLTRVAEAPLPFAAAAGAVGGGEEEDDEDDGEDDSDDGLEAMQGEAHLGSDGRWDPFAAARRRRALVGCEIIAAALCAALADQEAGVDGGARVSDIGEAASALIAR